MKLADVRKGKQPRPRAILIYGQEGVGKSSIASEAPRPIFIATEDGLADIDCHAFPVAKSFPAVIEALKALFLEEHDYQTLVLDTLSNLERLIWEAVTDKRGVDSIDEIGYAKGYSFAVPYWRQVVQALDDLRNQKQMTILLLAHAQVEKFDDPESESYDRFSPRLHKKAAALMVEWCDEVLFARYKTFTKTEGEGFNKRTIGIGTQQRVLRTISLPSAVAKNRARLPEELPLSWNVLAEQLPGYTKATATKEKKK